MPSKRFKKALEQVDAKKSYPLKSAVEVLSKFPKAKFNAAQRLAYTGVILMGFGSLVTGLAIYKPTQLAWLTTALGGYTWARGEHFALTVGYVVFFLIHIAQVIKAGWNNFRAMVTGYELTPTEERTHATA